MGANPFNQLLQGLNQNQQLNAIGASGLPQQQMMYSQTPLVPMTGNPMLDAQAFQLQNEFAANNPMQQAPGQFRGLLPALAERLGVGGKTRQALGDVARNTNAVGQYGPMGPQIVQGAIMQEAQRRNQQAIATQQALARLFAQNLQSTEKTREQSQLANEAQRLGLSNASSLTPGGLEALANIQLGGESLRQLQEMFGQTANTGVDAGLSRIDARMNQRSAPKGEVTTLRMKGAPVQRQRPNEPQLDMTGVEQGLSQEPLMGGVQANVPGGSLGLFAPAAISPGVNQLGGLLGATMGSAADIAKVPSQIDANRALSFQRQQAGNLSQARIGTEGTRQALNRANQAMVGEQILTERETRPLKVQKAYAEIEKIEAAVRKGEDPTIAKQKALKVANDAIKAINKELEAPEVTEERKQQMLRDRQALLDYRSGLLGSQAPAVPKAGSLPATPESQAIRYSEDGKLDIGGTIDSMFGAR